MSPHVVQRKVWITTCPSCHAQFEYAHQDLLPLIGFVFYDLAVACPVCRVVHPHNERETVEPEAEPDSGQPVEEAAPSDDASTDDPVSEVDQQRDASDSEDGGEEAGSTEDD